MTNIEPERAAQPGRIFVLDIDGHDVTDLNTMELVSLPPGAHILSMGGVADRYEFCHMEEQWIFALDAMDALLLELYAQEIV